MKITFDDKSFIECRKSTAEGKILMIISAQDQDNPRKKTTNTVEITQEEFQRLISEVTST
jgi:hypothetical protein